MLPDGMVKVAVEAFGVNRADTLQRQGHYPPPKGESTILGLEVAGTVSEVASGITHIKEGDRVFGLVAGGGYATEVIVNPSHLMAIPEGMPFVEAAGLAEVFLTAFQCLRTIAHVKPAQRSLIHGGASGVGSCRYPVVSLLGRTQRSYGLVTGKIGPSQREWRRATGKL